MASFARSSANILSEIREREEDAVSWPAVFGGAVVAASLALILIALGSGLGLASVSPWSDFGASPSAVGIIGIVWIVVTQILASAFGGYLAGRLRTRWLSVHTDEIYFRDTAHGLLVWAVGVVLTVSLLVSAAVRLSGASDGRSGTTASDVAGVGYFADELLRTDRANGPVDMHSKEETQAILVHGLAAKGMPAEDRAYLANLVSARTGLSQSEAQSRVNRVLENARQTADDARRATSHVLLWSFLALLIGAFSASLAATIGGRQRDAVKAANA